VDDDAGGRRDGALIAEDEFADAFARGPGVDDISGAGVGKKTGLGEQFRVGGGMNSGSRTAEIVAGLKGTATTHAWPAAQGHGEAGNVIRLLVVKSP